MFAASAFGLVGDASGGGGGVSDAGLVMGDGVTVAGRAAAGKPVAGKRGLVSGGGMFSGAGAAAVRAGEARRRCVPGERVGRVACRLRLGGCLASATPRDVGSNRVGLRARRGAPDVAASVS